MKDLFEAINTRIKEPYWGFLVLSFLAFNWKGLFLLCFSIGTAQQKIALFEAETNFWSLIVFPVVTALFILLITPWLKVLFGWMSRLAYEKLNSQELDREHKYLAEKNKLEKERAKELANKENELIDQAKRDVDIENIENENVKDSLKREIEQLRKERNDIVHNVGINKSLKNDFNLNEFEKTILRYLSLNNDYFIKRGKDLQVGQFIKLGDQSIYKTNDARDYLKYEQGIKSLIERNFIYDLGEEGKIYELTDFGRDFITKSGIL